MTLAIENLSAYVKWSRDVFGVDGEVAEAASKIRRKAVRGAFNDIVDESPWKTGRFRASWRVANGAPDPTSEPDGKPYYRAPGAEILEPVLAHAKLNVPIFLSNSVPYARRLAFGWSKQASSGWVVRAVRRNAKRAAGGV